MPGICMETCGGVAARDASCAEMNFFWCAGDYKHCFLQKCMLEVKDKCVLWDMIYMLIQLGCKLQSLEES